jgi:hypothetical protein
MGQTSHNDELGVVWHHLENIEGKRSSNHIEEDQGIQFSYS